MTRVLAVDDHTVVATALIGALQSHGYDARWCPVHSGAQVLSVARTFLPAVVLLDIELGPAGSGAALIAPLREMGARVVMLTATEDPIRLAECLEAGADAVLSKGVRIDDVILAIEEAGGEHSIELAAQNRGLLTHLQRHRTHQRAVLGPFDLLTPSEQEVLAALCQGKAAQDVAGETFRSVRTVRGHIQGILDKLGVRSQHAAVARANDVGWHPGVRNQNEA